MPITEDLINTVNSLKEEELLELNRLCVSAIQTERDRKMQTMRSMLSIGDAVTFTGRERGRAGRRFPVVGTISKIKRKRAEVNAHGQTWDVSITMLKKV